MITKHKPGLQVETMIGEYFPEFYPGYVICFETLDLLENWVTDQGFTPNDSNPNWFVYSSNNTEVHMLLVDITYITN